MTPQELKQGILLRAIQGKLVEQRPEEGTGEELFETITFTKNNSLVEISEDEIPFEIPDSWKWVRHNTLFEIVGGSQPPKSKFIDQPKSGYVRLYQIRDYGDKPVPVYVPIDMVSKFTKKGDILLARYGGSLGKVFWAEEGAYNVAMAKVVALFSEGPIDKNYLYYYYFAPLYQNLVKGNSRSAQAGFNKEDLDSLMFPLPPLAEQKRIVARIEELLPLIDRYEEAWTKLEDFTARFPFDMQKSILQMAIQGKLVEQRPEEGTGDELYKQIQAEKAKLIKEGKSKKEKTIVQISDDEMPFDIPDSWKWVRLGTIGYTNIGLTYSPKDVSSEGTIVLRSSNIQEGRMDYNDIVKVKVEVPDNKMCRKGDILICARNGSKRLVGKAAIIDADGMSFGAFMAIFRSECNQFIYYVINSAYFRNTLLGDTGTTTINQITQDMLKNVLVPLPPIAEQKRIVAKLEEILPLCDRLK